MNIFWLCMRLCLVFGAHRKVFRWVGDQSVKLRCFRGYETALGWAAEELLKRGYRRCPECRLLFESEAALDDHLADTGSLCYRSLQRMVCPICSSVYYREDGACPTCVRNNATMNELDSVFEEFRVGMRSHQEEV